MGCLDVFCFACGNPCHSLIKENIEEILEIYKDYMESLKKSPNKVKLSKYNKEIITQINSDPNFITKLKNLYKQTQWLNKCTFLTVTDKIIHGCKETACSTDFEDSKGNTYYHDINSGIYTDIVEKVYRGIFIHTDCWKLIKSQYKIDIKYSDVPAIDEKNQYYKINSKIDYKPIEKYWGQDFNFVGIMLDSNEYMCESPFTNNKNASRIKKILSQMKINTDLNRKGPSVSATFYPDKTIKYGLDKKIWIKSNGKWNLIKESNDKISIEINTGKLNPEQRTYLNKLVCIGEPGKEKVFILAMKESKNYKFEFVGTSDDINKIKKLFAS